jgi:hypothetical protein
MNVLVCSTACSRDSFTKSDLDRRNLFRAMRFSKLFEVLCRAVKRLPGHLRDRVSESFDGFGYRGYSIECAIADRALAASGGWFWLRAPFSHFSLLTVEIIHQICVIIAHVCGLRNQRICGLPHKIGPNYRPACHAVAVLTTKAFCDI